MAKRVKFKLNGKEVEADEGRLVIDAAKDEGVEIPHYCYHPALGNPGNCRMCIVEVTGAPKPQVSCRTGVREGMDVKSDSCGSRFNDRLARSNSNAKSGSIANAGGCRAERNERPK